MLVSSQIWKGCKEISTPLPKVQPKGSGKRSTGSTINVTYVGLDMKQLFVTDKRSGSQFLVDIGAQVSVIPATWLDKHNGPSQQPLQAANGTNIKTYGSCNMPLDINNHRYQAHLIIADFKHSILGADFLQTHNLLVNLRRGCLNEADFYATFPCSVRTIKREQLAMIETTSNSFRRILNNFPEILQPTFSTEEVKHGIRHHILTTGPPVFA